MEKMIEKVVASLLELDTTYEKADTKMKREIIGSFFPEKLIFSEGGYRTARVNEIASLIYQINNDLAKTKNGTDEDFSYKFRSVPLPEQLPNHFLDNLQKIANMVFRL